MNIETKRLREVAERFNEDDAGEDLDAEKCSPMLTFFWNCAIAVALAAARQQGMVARPITERHAHRQKQIEKLRHQLQNVVEWARPVEALAAEAEVMHKEVARLRAELAAIARLNIGIASERARRALGADPETEAA